MTSERSPQSPQIEGASTPSLPPPEQVIAEPIPQDPIRDIFTRMMDAYQREHFPFGLTASFMRPNEDTFTSVAVHCDEVDGVKQVAIWRLVSPVDLQVDNTRVIVFKEGEDGVKATRKQMREDRVEEKGDVVSLDWASTIDELADGLDEEGLYIEVGLDGEDVIRDLDGISSVPLFPIWRGSAED